MADSKHTPTGNCRNCLGTGQVYLAKSWFVADGYTRQRCPICNGTKNSTFRPDPTFVKFQKRASASEGA